MLKKCVIYKEGKLINTVTYQRDFGVWRATHFENGNPLPFTMYDLLEDQRRKLERGGFTWEWIS